MNGAPDYGPSEIVVVSECMEQGLIDSLPIGHKYFVKEVFSFPEWPTKCRVCGEVRTIAVSVVGGKLGNKYLSCKFRKLDPTTDLPAMTKTKVSEVQS